MNIDHRLAELENLKRARPFAYNTLVAAAAILYASLSVAAFESHRLLAVCVTFCLALCLWLLLRTYNLRIEERVLRKVKENLGNA